ncbi:MAG: hypothetical protein ACJ74T_09280 [Pyrinomonadaceae bacterium]
MLISVKCPACGLVDWNVGNCKRCETPLAGLSADGDGDGYFQGVSEWAAEARTVRTARLVMAVCAFVVLGLTALGALYLAHSPANGQWFWSFYRNEPTVAEIFAHNLKVSGGAERLAGLRSFRATGQIAFSDGESERLSATGKQVTFVMHTKQPDKVETEIEIGAAKKSESAFDTPPPSFSPAAPEVTVSLRSGFDGTRGWEYIERTILASGSTIPIKQHSSRELDDDELEKMKHYAKTTGVLRLSDEYTALKFIRREPITWAGASGLDLVTRKLDTDALRGHEAYVVSGVNREGKDETFYFDTITGLLLRVDFEAEDKEGATARVECRVGDYREVGGLRLPHRLLFKRGEESATLTFEQYFPNDPVPDSTFESPE